MDMFGLVSRCIMLHINNISFAYQNQKTLYEDIEYDFGTHGMTAICGISWSGKTTLLHIIGGIIKPQRWSVVFEWLPIHDLTIDQLAEYRNKDVWFSFQDHVLLEDCNVNHNLDLPFLLWWWSMDSAWRKYLIDMFDIQWLLHKSIDQISGWEKERVSIIKAFIHKPSVLILDEPGDSLDQQKRKKLFALMQTYAEQNLVIFTTHSDQTLEDCSLHKACDREQLQFFTQDI